MLNHQLYRILLSSFGDVKIAKEGQPFLWKPNILESDRDIEIIDYGETYRVNCPFCARRGDPDHRNRLWISHCYGTVINGKRRWGLATCFHNNCLEDSAARDELRHIITGKASDRYLRPVILRSGKYDYTAPIKYELPGACIRISELDISHKSNQFLLSRGVDPLEADRIFKIYYCFSSDKYPYAIDKLVFPIYFQGKEVCWQCRYIGKPSDKSVPKYYSAPGFSIKSYLYNYDLAIKEPFIVIVEGILDVLKIGTNAIAIFGKTLSATQISLLKTIKDKQIVIFLDPDANKEAEKIARDLYWLNPIVISDSRDDPGKLSREELDACFNRYGLVRSVST